MDNNDPQDDPVIQEAFRAFNRLIDLVSMRIEPTPPRRAIEATQQTTGISVVRRVA